MISDPLPVFFFLSKNLLRFVDDYIIMTILLLLLLFVLYDDGELDTMQDNQ